MFCSLELARGVVAEPNVPVAGCPAAQLRGGGPGALLGPFFPHLICPRDPAVGLGPGWGSLEGTKGLGTGMGWDGVGWDGME